MPVRRRRKLALTVSERLDVLAGATSDPPWSTRLYLSKEHLAAARLVRRWMQDAGMVAAIDAAGTVVGRYEADRPGARTLVLGSHIDTVHNAGKFGGCLGVVIAVEAVAELNRRTRRLPYAIEVMAFGDEVGGRFTPMAPGSRAIAGQFDAAVLDARDAAGTTMRRALQEFGGAPDQVGTLARSTASLLGFLEVYSEQGPVLEAEGLPVGVITAISGLTRLNVTVGGAAGHACTMPLAQRRDALAAAAEMVLATEVLCRQTAGLVATVGRIAVEPDKADAIPQSARLEVEMRSPVDRTRRTGLRNLERTLKGIARRRRCEIEIETVLEVPAADCDARIIAQLTSAVERCGVTGFGMPSGFGTGGTSFARVCPVGMLVLRCKNGVSCHPSEFVKSDDIEVALKVLLDFLVNLDMIGAR